MASISVTPSARAASTICSNSIRAPDLDLAEARRAGSVAGAHHLFGLALAAVGNSPQSPVLATGDGVARIPEFGRDAAVAGVLEHADALAVTDLPADFATELEVVTLVVDGPAFVGLHVDAVRRVEDLVERLVAREQADVGHADEREAAPAIGAHAAVGAHFVDCGGGFARGHQAGEEAF